jgi:hypothetical protein
MRVSRFSRTPIPSRWAVEAGGGVVQTADPDDLARLAAPYRTIVIEPLGRRKGSPD